MHRGEPQTRRGGAPTTRGTPYRGCRRRWLFGGPRPGGWCFDAAARQLLNESQRSWGTADRPRAASPLVPMVEAVAAGASLLQRHGDRCRQVAELLLPRLTHMQASCIGRCGAGGGPGKKRQDQIRQLRASQGTLGPILVPAPPPGPFPDSVSTGEYRRVHPDRSRPTRALSPHPTSDIPEAAEVADGLDTGRRGTFGCRGAPPRPPRRLRARRAELILSHRFRLRMY